MNQKIRVGVLFGGKSAEHEVSLQSAKNVIDAMDPEKYEVVRIGITKDGQWRTSRSAGYLLEVDDPKRIHLNPNGASVALLPGTKAGELVHLETREDTPPLDVVFPVLHGTYGEDGAAQGLLKLAGVPFVGAGVLGSAVGMDKDVAKRLMRDAGIPTSRFLVFRRVEEARAAFERVERELGLPCFIKPANLGSSVGTHKVRDRAQYEAACADAFTYDRKILVEEFIPCREIECAVLGNENPIASLPGEVIPHHEFYSYEAKYVDENGAGFEIPAKLPDETIAEVQRLAVQTFTILECEGMARVDFFLRNDGRLFVNEINTIPGFTQISMYPKLWAASGIPYAELIDRLIQLALERHRRESALKTSFF